jgi:hypothetical protein
MASKIHHAKSDHQNMTVPSSKMAEIINLLLTIDSQQKVNNYNMHCDNIIEVYHI